MGHHPDVSFDDAEKRHVPNCVIAARQQHQLVLESRLLELLAQICACHVCKRDEVESDAKYAFLQSHA